MTADRLGNVASSLCWIRSVQTPSPAATAIRFAMLAMIVALIGTISLVVAPPAGAHTALLEASPGPDETVGGVIDGIDLAFLDPITDAIVTVSYNGAPVAGATTVADGELIRFQFDEPLQLDGRYQVFYEMTSFDLDYTTSGFFFTYAAGAPQPPRLEAPGAGDGSSFPVVPTVIGTTLLVAVLAVFVWQFDARRRQSAGDGPDHAEYGHDGYGAEGYSAEYDEGHYHDGGDEYGGGPTRGGPTYESPARDGGYHDFDYGTGHDRDAGYRDPDPEQGRRADR